MATAKYATAAPRYSDQSNVGVAYQTTKRIIEIDVRLSGVEYDANAEYVVMVNGKLLRRFTLNQLERLGAIQS